VSENEIEKDIKDFENKKITLIQLANKHGIHPGTLSVRINERYTIYEALTTPLFKRLNRDTFIGNTNYKTLKK
jgi:hypothetical protein